MSNDSLPCFIYSKDLMFSSQANSAAAAAGFDTKTVLGTDQVNQSSKHFVVIDLSMPGLDIASVVSKLANENATLIAVGPHVHEAKLALAQESGCDVVLTKGQASRELGSVLKRLAEAKSD